jgi:8-oxo-dGTP pyrophosphatase MutT (NUDIX family)
MHLKIYFGDKPVFLCDAIDAQINECLHHFDVVFVDEFNNKAIKSVLHEIEKPEFHAGVIVHSDLEALRKAFWKHFLIVEAAGGLVQNEKEEWLFIYRRGKWDLPKGKIDKGEQQAAAALREVEEETGLSNLELGKLIATTYHTYNDYGHHTLKPTYWYAMKAKSAAVLVPQTTEDITEIGWMSQIKWKEIQKNTYPSIVEVLKAVS